ncbi:MAG: glycosyltransferase family A protein [Acidobacteriota bacterium]
MSVVVPAFNAEKHLGEALLSVLDQTRRPDEILVVDDGSQDDTVRVAERVARRSAESGSTPVRILRGEHRGPGPTRNRGIEAAQGEFLGFLDADDLWLPHKLALQIDVLKGSADVDLVFGSMDQFFSPELTREERSVLVCKPEPTPTPLLSCLLARRSVFDRVGLLEDHLADFLSWSAKAKALGVQKRFVEELVARRRIHGANLSNVRKAEMQRDYLRAARASLQRRRRAAGGDS